MRFMRKRETGPDLSGNLDGWKKEIFFSDFQTAISHLKKNYPEESFEKLRFTKQYFSGAEDESEKKLILEMNHDLEILSVDEQTS